MHVMKLRVFFQQICTYNAKHKSGDTSQNIYNKGEKQERERQENEIPMITQHRCMIMKHGVFVQQSQHV